MINEGGGTLIIMMMSWLMKVDYNDDVMTNEGGGTLIIMMMSWLMKVVVLWL